MEKRLKRQTTRKQGRTSTARVYRAIPQPFRRLVSRKLAARLVAEAQRRFKSLPNVVGASLGVKHSRRRGYGARDRLCIKIFVHRKLPPSRLRRAYRIPASISLSVQGRRVRLPTDVLSLARAVHHAQVPRCYWPISPNPEFGTPGFVAASGVASWMVTAGHIFNGKDNGPGVSQIVQLDTPAGAVDLGEIVWGQTSFDDPPGSQLLRDIATIKLPGDPTRLPPALDLWPWAAIKGVATLAALQDRLGKLIPIICRLAGCRSQPMARLDTFSPFPLPFQDLGLTYAPVLVHLTSIPDERGITQPFLGGDSGAPIVIDQTDELVAIHVVAPNAQLDNPDQPSFESWGILAATILGTLSRRMNVPLRLV
jgi:hypothetical protein